MQISTTGPACASPAQVRGLGAWRRLGRRARIPVMAAHVQFKLNRRVRQTRLQCRLTTPHLAYPQCSAFR